MRSRLWGTRIGSVANARMPVRFWCVRFVAVAVLLAFARAAPAQALPAQVPPAQMPSAQTPSSRTPSIANQCVACHANLHDVRLATPARLFSQADIHRESGFACVACHGGDAGAVESERAHDRAHGFLGKPIGQAIIATCARCHSDADLMRRFAPRQRVDQAVEYATSIHGKQLATGDTHVATCASCHGAHGIRRVKDARSPVFPTNVAATCATCHGSPQHMSGYKLPDGTPLPTNQFAEYQKSVHYAALTRGNDLSAPACNACHGNHGAAPPGVGAVANVCGTCHAVFAQKFETSVHRQIFDKGCVECHGNHAVLKPSDEMLGASGHAICATCHNSADDAGATSAGRMRGSIERLKASIGTSSALIARVRNAGIEVSAQELALAEARSHLTLARTEMHTFEAARVDSVVQSGLKITSAVDTAGQQAVAELRFRRRGLAASLGAILLVVVALGLKVRDLDAQQRATSLSSTK
jgi:predicted CXXCH cytochrome family protein